MSRGEVTPGAEQKRNFAYSARSKFRYDHEELMDKSRRETEPAELRIDESKHRCGEK